MLNTKRTKLGDGITIIEDETVLSSDANLVKDYMDDFLDRLSSKELPLPVLLVATQGMRARVIRVLRNMNKEKGVHAYLNEQALLDLVMLREKVTSFNNDISVPFYVASADITIPVLPTPTIELLTTTSPLHLYTHKEEIPYATSSTH